MKISASADANSTGKGRGFRLSYRVLQLSEAPSLSGISFVNVWDKEKELFKNTLIGEIGEFSIEPGATAEQRFPRDSKSKAVLVIASFYRPRPDCWYHVHSLEHGSTVQLSVGASCLSAVTK